MRKVYNFGILFLCLAAVLTSCGSKKNVRLNSGVISEYPKIIFLNYSLSCINNDDNSKNLRCISKIITDGRIKQKPNVNMDVGVPGDLVCRQLDKNSNILQSFLVKNPLKEIIEYADENKLLRMKKMDLDSAQFSLRLQLFDNTKYISISDYNESSPLSVTEINETK